MDQRLNQERQQTHALVDRLSPDKLAVVRNLLEKMVDPPPKSVPTDDEPETDEERRSVSAALESLERNGGVPLETVLSDLGLTKEDFDKMGRTPLPHESGVR